MVLIEKMFRKFLLGFVLFFVSFAFAEEMPKCSFGSTPLHTQISIFPGGEVIIPWSMYNYYGTGLTLVNISFEETDLFISVNLNKENDIVLRPNFSSSQSSVPHPLTGIPIPSEEVYVTIRAHKNEIVSTSKQIILTANAFCPLDSGLIIPGIQTELVIDVKIINKLSYFNYLFDDFIFYFFLMILVITFFVGFIILKRKINNSRITNK
ncbi:MAG: hypothetical protein GON13_03835 [Nanoarchaeota archaeon]|nr:hypothetical protein [Nanoarchaeota archaeon]